MEKDDLILKTMLSCVQLRQLDELRMPINNASGVIINYCNKKVLLSVFHATRDFSNWALEIKSDVVRGTLLKELGLLGTAIIGNMTTDEIERLDFSYTTLADDIKTFHQVIEPETNKIYEHERLIIDIDFDVKPSENKTYSFFGQTEIKNNGLTINSVGKLITEMKFVKEEGQFYIFKLPYKHPGHIYFKGTSGAPILDSDGNLVSIVCKGEEEQNIKEDHIFGLNLRKYKSIIDIQVT
jgi:hypothetical protein